MLTRKHSAIFVVGMFLICIAACLLAASLFYNLQREVVRYPGAQKISGHEILHLFPHFYFRQDDSFITPDNFTKVFNWYSGGFNLGPERAAQSNCSLTGNTVKQYGIERVMTVTVCDTPNGRMVFVERSLEFDFR